MTQSHILIVADHIPDDLIALDEALTKLKIVDSDAARLVQLRYFTGLSIPEAAESLSISARTANRLRAFARAWLRREIFGSSEPPANF